MSLGGGGSGFLLFPLRNTRTASFCLSHASAKGFGELGGWRPQKLPCCPCSRGAFSPPLRWHSGKPVSERGFPVLEFSGRSLGLLPRSFCVGLNPEGLRVRGFVCGPGALSRYRVFRLITKDEEGRGGRMRGKNPVVCHFCSDVWLLLLLAFRFVCLFYALQ